MESPAKHPAAKAIKILKKDFILGLILPSSSLNYGAITKVPIKPETPMTISAAQAQNSGLSSLSLSFFTLSVSFTVF